MQLVVHAKIEATLQDQVHQYTKIWQPWVDKFFLSDLWSYFSLIVTGSPFHPPLHPPSILPLAYLAPGLMTVGLD